MVYNYKTRNDMIDKVLSDSLSFEQVDWIVGKLCDDNLQAVLDTVLDHIQNDAYANETERKIASRTLRDMLNATGV